MHGYVLHVNGKAVAAGKTLQDVQTVATQYLSKKEALEIHSAMAPAPSQTWHYDYAMQQWVELIRKR